MKQPLVSIIINNYNYGHFLSDSIDSALAQTYPRTEVIVVDDGSTDNSRKIIAKYGNRIISVLKENGGQASAFNAGFAASKGDIICFLDSDDVFFTEKVAEIVNIFEHQQSIEWCFHRIRFVDAKTEAFIKLSRESGSRTCDFRTQSRNGKFSFNPPATSGLCFSRLLLQQILPMPEATDVTISDLYIKTAAVALEKGFFLDRQLASLKVHGSNRYTSKKNNQLLKASIAILTAYHLRNKWPFLRKYTNRLLSQGISAAWRAKGMKPEMEKTTKKYLMTVSTMEKIEINCRTFYYYLKR